MKAAAKRFFSGAGPVHHGAAPGRLDVIGGIADYSGGFVLQTPIQQHTNAWAALRDDGTLCAASVQDDGAVWRTEIPVPSLDRRSKARAFKQAREWLASHEGGEWAAYSLGCALALSIEYDAPLNGVDLWIESDVPLGKGVSSSASLEVACMIALAKAMKLTLKNNELPILAQSVENRIVGAPCGLMDQLACYHGRPGEFLPIICRPDRLLPRVKIPKGMHFVGIDSGVRHSVGGASYGDVRAAAFMGYSIIAQAEGASRNMLKQARKTGDRSRLPHEGYLTNINPSLWRSRYAEMVPERITGAAFNKKHGESIDDAAPIDPKTNYYPRVCAGHPVFEQHRVEAFYHTLRGMDSLRSRKDRETAMGLLGEWMMQSHESYSACGLGCQATDELVERARQAGVEEGVYGAKITGGGSGGVVCILSAGRKGLAAARRIADEFGRDHGFAPRRFIISAT